MTDNAFSEAEREAVYRAIAERRDMRHFSGGEVAPELLARLLEAAHHLQHRGLMQPWRFIRITDRALRERMHELVEVERRATAKALGEREEDFMRLKVEGLREAGEVIVVALADGREQHIFGRRTLPEMDLASVACAIQNMWLAARAEGIGLGWVSIFDPAELATILGLPLRIIPVAYLCLGYVSHFRDRPDLEAAGWRERLPLEQLVFLDRWGETGDDATAGLRDRLRRDQRDAATTRRQGSDPS